MGHINERYDRDKRAVLGGGTYATVYAARCKRTGQLVALKKLRRVATAAAAATTGKLHSRVGADGATAEASATAAAAAAAAAAESSLYGGLSPLPFVFHAGEGPVAAAAAAAGTERGDDGPDDRGGVSQAALREIKVLQELRHPHIVRLRETFEHKNTLVLVFDYAAGGDLELLLYPPVGGGSGGGGCLVANGDGVSLSGSGFGSKSRSGSALPTAVIKAHMKALLEALAYCHEQGVLHRDVKPNNLLLDGQGQLLLADFGLARYLPLDDEEEEDVGASGREPAPAGRLKVEEAEEEGGGGGGRGGAVWLRQQPGGRQPGPPGGGEVAVAAQGGDGSFGERPMGRAAAAAPTARSLGEANCRGGRCRHYRCRHHHARPVMTHQVGMRWYRPPELLFGCRTYGTGVDIWAVGCVFAEMMLRRVWFKGSSDMEQLSLIFEALGTPSEESWPGVMRLPNYLRFPPTPPKDLATEFPGATPDALDLLRQLTSLCPEHRPTARQALSHPYFTAATPPAPPGQLPLAMTRVEAAAVVHPSRGWGRERAAAATAAAAAGPGGRREAALAAAAPPGPLPVFRALRGLSGGSHQIAGEGTFSRFQLPLLPPLALGRLPPGRLSLDEAAAAAGDGVGGALGVTQPFRLGSRPSLHFPDLSGGGYISSLFPPPPVSSTAGDVAAAVAAAVAGATAERDGCSGGGGGGNGLASSGLAFPNLRAFNSLPRLRNPHHPAMAVGPHEDDLDCLGGGGGETAARTSSTEVPYDTALPPPPRRQQQPDAAASAPRRYRRGRRTRSSVATADMSISEVWSVGMAGRMAGGRLCFDEVDRREAANGVEGEEGQMRYHTVAAAADEVEEDGGREGELEAAAEEDGEQALDGEEEGEDAAEEDEEEEDEFGEFRRCVARRFSFGSSLMTEGDAAAAGPGAGPAAAAAAGQPPPPLLPPPGSPGGAMAVTVVSDGGGGDAGLGRGGGGGATHRSGDSDPCGADSVVPMVTTMTTAEAARGDGGDATVAAGYDPMCISVSMCGGPDAGGGGMGTVGSKRPRAAAAATARDFLHHQTQPPTPVGLAATLAEGQRGLAHSCLRRQVHLDGGGGGAAAATVSVAPSITMVSATAAAPCASVNAMAPDGSGGAAATMRGMMEAPPPQPIVRRSRPSDVTVAMSFSFAGGIDAAAATAHVAFPHAAPLTAVGPHLPRGSLVAEQPSVRGPQPSAVGGCGGGGGDPGGGGGGTNMALSGFPSLLPPLAPRVPAATADVGVIAAAVAAAGGGAADDGGFGCDVSGSVVAAAAPAALSGSVHFRPGPGGVRPDSIDLLYLRQRKVEVDEALRQASHADHPQVQDAGELDRDLSRDKGLGLAAQRLRPRGGPRVPT